MSDCPFCREAERLAIAECEVFWVECLKCLATGPAAKTMIEAITAWDTNVPRPEIKRGRGRPAKHKPK